MAPQTDFGVLGPLRVFQQVGPMGVATFFVLSGYLLARPFWVALDAGEPMPSLRTYALRRAARILPGYWLALCVSFVLSVTIFAVPLDGALVLRFLAGFLLVSDWHWLTLFPVEFNSPLWSISFEISSYVLLPLCLAGLFALRRVSSGRWMMRVIWFCGIGIVLFAHALFMRFFPVDAVDGSGGEVSALLGDARRWMPEFNPFAFFAIFAIGALASGCQVLMQSVRHWFADGLMVVALIFAALTALRSTFDTADGYGLLSVPFGFPDYPLALGLILAIGPSTIAIARGLDWPARYIAGISFGIYVWHYLVIEVVRITVAPDFTMQHEDNVVAYVVTSGFIVLATFAIAHLSFYLMERPIMRWARSLEGGSPGLRNPAGDATKRA
jgi:peptidoglycan/LPS O-acetylase OafA/YrhL